MFSFGDFADARHRGAMAEPDDDASTRRSRRHGRMHTLAMAEAMFSSTHDDRAKRLPAMPLMMAILQEYPR